MNRELLQQAFDCLSKEERHHTAKETFYWCNQYKLFAQKLLDELAKPVNEFNPDWDMVAPLVERVNELEAELHEYKKQKPIAWYAQDNLEIRDEIEIIWNSEKPTYAEVWIPLYTSPPRKEWVGLTSEELVNIVVKHPGSPTEQLFAIEAKLRSKNER